MLHIIKGNKRVKEVVMRLITALAIVTVAALPASAAWYTSDHYAIERDVLAGGGNRMESSSYVLESTLGQPSPVGVSESEAHTLEHGFWHAEFLAGDVILDGCINVADLIVVRNNLGNTGSDIVPPTADVTGEDGPDGIVNVADMMFVRNRLGRGPNCP